MFEVGFTEIVLIFGIALLVLGPARLPRLAADLGRWAGRARSMARQLRSQLEQEVQYDPLAPSHAVRDEDPSTIHAPPPEPDLTARAIPTQVASDLPRTASRAHESSATDPGVDAPSTAAPSDERKPG